MQRPSPTRPIAGKIGLVLAALLIFTTGFALGNHNVLRETAALAMGGDGRIALNGQVVNSPADQLEPPANADELFAPFWQVYNLIEDQYVGEVDEETLVNGAIDGLVGSLEDEYSGYMDPTEYPLLNSDLSGEFEGIGVVIQMIDETGQIEVVNVLEGSPAEAAGLEPGDIFIEVDDVSVAGLDQIELSTLVRGPAGTEVKLTLQRDDELVEITVVRDRIEIVNIEYEVLENNIGYIRLNQFTAEARAEIDTALEALDVDNLNGLILDLRGNPGGFLSSAIEVSSAFVEEGPVVIEEFGDGSRQELDATGDFLDLEIPLVVLVNGTSASASEIVAGAVQDYGVGTLIGETTFGKGTVQTWQELVNGGGVRLTIARWLTPNGNWIDEGGITPDIEVEWTVEQFEADPETDPQLNAAIDFLTEGEPAQ